MVHYQKPVYNAPVGEWLAELVSIEQEPNQFYKPEKPDSGTETVLTIGFELIDQVSWERTDFTQKFVKPTVFDKGLFQQLLDVYGFGPEEEGDFDEKQLIGLKVMLMLEKNEKGFSKIAGASRVPEKVKKTAAKKDEQAADDTPSDLPFP